MLNWSLGVSLGSTQAHRRLTRPMAGALLALLACAGVRLSGLDQAGISFCYFKALTGYACLTCGSTRALGYLSRLDVSSAFAIQPLVTSATLLVVLWGSLDAILSLVSRRTVVRIGGNARLPTVVAAVSLAILNWIYLLFTSV